MIDVTKQLSECFSLSGYDTRLLIVKFVSPIIPPLTNIDLERLVLSIPLLASSLVEPSSFVVEKELNEELSSLLPLLCDFALNDDIDKRTRSSTSLIIHSIILKCIQVEDNLPLIALKKSIFPVLEESSMKNNRETFSNALRLAISVVSYRNQRLVLLYHICLHITISRVQQLLAKVVAHQAFPMIF